MQLNIEKCKYMQDSLLEQVAETRLLGVIIREDLAWHSNTKDLVIRGYQRMLILRKLYSFNVLVEDLVQIYCLYIRSILEQSSVVWSSSITKGQEYELERVQKVALRVILDESYLSYADALESTGLNTLKERRRDLSLTFAKKCTRKEATQSMFPLNPPQVNTRKRETF